MPSTPALALARSAYHDRAWGDAFTALHRLDGDAPLAAADLERLAVAAWLTGHEAEAVAALERLHHGLLNDDASGAVRAAVWLAILHFQRGESAQGGGWMARATRQIDDLAPDSPSRALVMVPRAVHSLNSGNPEEALAMFRAVAASGEATGDVDLQVLGLLGRGQSLVMLGDIEAGLGLLDEALVAATTGPALPILVGIVYCAVIIACRAVFDLRRAQEWTAALSRWCTRQQDLKPYRGQCLVHRSQIMQLHGDWTTAREEIDEACTHFATVPGDPAMGMAHYQQAELLRLIGEHDTAEDAYLRASESGHPLHPGLALLRLAQGRVEDAARAIRQVVVDAEHDRVRRSAVLAAHVEIMLAAGEVAEADTAASELAAIAADFDSVWLQAQAATSRGLVCLALEQPEEARVELGAAWRRWRRLDAPYEAASVRVQMAVALRALGDHDTAQMELEAARSVFEELGATPALEAVLDMAGVADAPVPAGLTPREVEVLRLVATGATNRAVADDLVISEKTVARHLSNMFVKLDVSSRAAATAWAYEHDLV